MQLNSIRNMVSKALTDNEISEVSLRVFFLRRENKMKHILSLKQQIWNLIRCCQRNRKVLFRISEHPS